METTTAEPAKDPKPVKLKFWEKVGYGVGDTASNLYFQTFLYFTLVFYTDVFGLPASVVGTMLFVSRLFDAITDPVIGMLADRANTRWGKFRPFVFFFAVPMAVMGVLAFTTPDVFDDTGKLIYAYITYNGLMIFYTLVNVPYSSLMAVLTPNSMERVELSSFRFVGTFIGGLIIQFGTLYLVEFFGQGNEQLGWQLTMGAFGLLAVGLLFITFMSSKERIAPPQKREKTMLHMKDLFTNTAWLMIAAATVFQLIFIVVRSSAIAYYFRYYVGDQTVNLFGFTFDAQMTDLNAVFLGLGSACTILGVLLTKKIAKFFDKKMTYIGCMAISAVMSLLFFYMPPESIVPIFLTNLVVSFVWGPVSVLQWAMYTDAADYSEWKNHRRATGMLMAISLFAIKMGLAIGGGVTGWALSYYGFEANADQTAEATRGILMLMSYIPAFFGLLCLICMLIYPLNNKTMDDIETQLKERRAKEGTDKPQHDML